MMKRALITSLLSISFVLIKAQSDFKPGYIILKNNDTIKGLIDYRDDVLDCKLCKYKDPATNTVTEYQPDSIAGYRFFNGRYFVSKQIDLNNFVKKEVFLEFLISGKANIFYFKDDSLKDHYYIEKEDLPLRELPYKIITKKIDGKTYEGGSNYHYGILKLYMQDCPEMFADIDKLKEPEHNNLIKLAEKYQHRACKNDNCIVYYEDKSPSVKFSLEPQIGFFKSRYSSDMSMYFGSYLYFWARVINEKLSFKTGLIFSNYKKQYPVTSNVKLPIQVQYTFPHGIVRPNLAIGTDIYFYSFYRACLNGGINFQVIKDKAFISLSSELEFTPIMQSVFIDRQGVSFTGYSYGVGIYFLL